MTCDKHAFKVMVIHTACDDPAIAQQILVQSNIGLDALHHHFTQCGLHARHGLLARAAMGDKAV